ncbi:acetyl-CoA carboxylase biotin carboxyl carrier protein [Peribacillus deserti]|uniref:Biotin carboxyl carrier protein of acetyl-CoA carboxylase n=1 Tax=Peribacillus deserti TaxID=673318 RepID=A0ABS2QJB7_9BACI|nr:acetyl-CoA carboxylase biotin carboxyl carrier protein [Peribacillus deserti]MBM7693256.1 acetyl-CoA carboxylase biotin carboxyl carrier protein [Peribacillus deserti]
MKVQEIRELIKLVDQSTLDEFEYEMNGTKIKMKKNSLQPEGITVQQVIPKEALRQEEVQAAPIPQPAAAEKPAEEKKTETAENLHKITSPMVGTFYQSPSPETDAYVKAGSKVSKNSVVCIVEAMKLFNEIEAEVDGEIVEILVKDGQLVEYGQPLFLVKPE